MPEVRRSWPRPTARGQTGVVSNKIACDRWTVYQQALCNLKRDTWGGRGKRSQIAIATKHDLDIREGE